MKKVRTEGTTTVDNGTTLFKADLPNSEELVLLYGMVGSRG